uniref:RRM domain-containing protein n=1 Tax=Chromera velia CCMP2878 TaxID=1169474 RepID=A0A0G4I292_9ALVE|eukprot:Cvel_10317.t1-p1 / transcript=Cvel_10317.t1 / gene=Cvel_10317 / organism=Chromera_velia_CCMP2878 / gene_product=High mobility group nucleosome-binding, putative / transcript_product=High mobility group nucleosome-binding, putative / location=Cvel_scaffold619:68060-70522(-) / protein_length=283 / sequence_SO=supercontig / SO=protein_coding / is_pseudo=false
MNLLCELHSHLVRAPKCVDCYERWCFLEDHFPKTADAHTKDRPCFCRKCWFEGQFSALPRDDENKRKIFVGNLLDRDGNLIPLDLLVTYFMSFGKVERIDHFKEQAEPFRPRPFGFVIYYKERYRQRALSQQYHAMKVPTGGGRERIHKLRVQAPKVDPREKSGSSRNRHSVFVKARLLPSWTQHIEGPPICDNTEGPPISDKSEGPPISDKSEGPPITDKSEGPRISDKSEGPPNSDKSEGPPISDAEKGGRGILRKGTCFGLPVRELPPLGVYCAFLEWSF